MARLEYFVVSRSVSVDQMTNNTSIFEILEQIHGKSFPIRIEECVATSLWLAEPGDDVSDFQFKLRVTLPNGAAHEIPTNFTLKTPRHRLIQRIGGLVVEQAGKVRFEATLNGNHAAEHVVDVIKVDGTDKIPTGN